MATPADVKAVLDVLCQHYSTRQEPKELNEVQASVYLDGLLEFPSEALIQAARDHMRVGKWFPALSELRERLLPKQDWPTISALAWTTVERAITRAGVYRGVVFEDPAIGEAVRQTFGTWEHACSYDRDSPGWAIKRQTFLSVFPSVADQASVPVVLRGLSRTDAPLTIAHVVGIPDAPKLLTEKDQSVNVLAEVTKRFHRLQEGKKR